MKKVLILVLCVFLVGCVSTSRSKLDYKGNYIDKSFTHTITVERATPLSEFGLTPEEWKTNFYDALLYKAYGKGNGFMTREEVKQFTCDAVKITTNNRHKKYAAIVEGQSGIQTSFLGQSSKTVSIYSPIEKYDFSCYAVMFDNEALIPSLREAFGRIQIITVE